MKSKQMKADAAPAPAGNTCEHISLDGFASAMARHPEKWYWCRDCKTWINGKGQQYGQLADTAPAQSGQHTPGPWEVHDGLVWSKKYGAICDPLSEVGNNRTQPEARANARLIAAAPDLLAACESMLHYFDAPNESLCANDAYKAADQARAAIAKALAR